MFVSQSTTISESDMIGLQIKEQNLPNFVFFLQRTSYLTLSKTGLKFFRVNTKKQ